MLVGFKSEVLLKRFKRILVIAWIISEAHENTAVLLVRLELENVEVVCLNCLETLMQTLQEGFLS